MLDCKVTVFETGYMPFHQQRGNSTRYIHPNWIDWPLDGSDCPHTDLPFLNWSAQRCDKVLREIELQWGSLLNSVNFHRNRTVSEVKEDGRRAAVIVEKPFMRCESDVIVVCTGFGRERQFTNVPARLYWDTDNLHQPLSVEGKHLLISGVGDGGLIDAMRALLHDFDHGPVVEKVVRHPPLAAVKDKIIEIDRRARAAGPDKGSSIILKGYEELHLADLLPDSLKRAVKDNCNVTLNAGTETPFDIRASALHRVIIYGLVEWGRITYLRGKMIDVARNEPRLKVTFRRETTTTTRTYDEAIIRHGPAEWPIEFLFEDKIVKQHLEASGQIKDAARLAYWDQKTFKSIPLGAESLELSFGRAADYRHDFKEVIERRYGRDPSVEISSGDDKHAQYVVASAEPLHKLPASFARIPVINRRPAQLHREELAWLVVLPIEPAGAVKEPTGIAIEGNSIYVADCSLGTLIRIEAGKVTKSYSGLNRPHHIAAVAGRILVTDTYNNKVLCFDPSLKLLWHRSSFAGVPLKLPHGVGCTTAEEFYILDSSNGRIVRRRGRNVDTFGSRGTPGLCGPGEFVEPCGLAVGPQEIYVADTHNHRIQIFDRTMRYVGAFGTYGKGEGEFAYPVGIASWRKWVVIADELNGRLQLWSMPETNSVSVPYPCRSSLCEYWLKGPFGLTFNTVGDLYVADRKGGKVLKIDVPEMLRELKLEVEPGQAA
jgi:hypothetical protein